MTTDLPPIPEAAVDAVVATFMPLDHPQVAGEREWVTADLTAAWPHLYAAALRHAADEVDALASAAQGPGATNSLIREGRGIAAKNLRHLAVEVTA